MIESDDRTLPTLRSRRGGFQVSVTRLATHFSESKSKVCELSHDIWTPRCKYNIWTIPTPLDACVFVVSRAVTIQQSTKQPRENLKIICFKQDDKVYDLRQAP